MFSMLFLKFKFISDYIQFIYILEINQSSYPRMINLNIIALGCLPTLGLVLFGTRESLQKYFYYNSQMMFLSDLLYTSDLSIQMRQTFLIDSWNIYIIRSFLKFGSNHLKNVLLLLLLFFALFFGKRIKNCDYLLFPYTRLEFNISLY